MSSPVKPGPKESSAAFSTEGMAEDGFDVVLVVSAEDIMVIECGRGCGRPWTVGGVGCRWSMKMKMKWWKLR